MAAPRSVAEAPAAPEWDDDEDAIEEPTLFDAPEEVTEAWSEPEPETVDDDLPPPAYRPRPEPAMTSSPEAFVAPRPAQAGTASPEALARLRAAVGKGGAAGGQQPRPQAAAQAPASATAAAPRADHGEERPRFGIGSLINRMSGGQGGHTLEPSAPKRQTPQFLSERPQAAAPAPRAAERARDEDREQDPDQERIEIPAFLRRQAN